MGEQSLQSIPAGGRQSGGFVNRAVKVIYHAPSVGFSFFLPWGKTIFWLHNKFIKENP